MTHKQRARWAAVFIAAAFGCGSMGLEQEVEVRRNWAIAIHGGAGHFGEEDLTVEQQAAYTASLSAALAAGERVLQQGGTSVEAVETVIRLMEDDSLFNAGRGAVFTAEGIQELDASIADGFTRNCGAVAGIRGYRHPISVARSVMDSSEHVFFSGHGVGAFVGRRAMSRLWTSGFSQRRLTSATYGPSAGLQKQMHSPTKKGQLDALRWTAKGTWQPGPPPVG